MAYEDNSSGIGKNSVLRSEVKNSVQSSHNNNSFSAESHKPPAKTKISDVTSSTLNSNNYQTLNIFHQNIRGLRNKTDEIFCHIPQNPPHVLCFTEHHLKSTEIISTHIDKYSLGASYCRKYFHEGGVSIFIREDLHFTNINLDTLCIDKDIEACAIRLDFLDVHLYILGVYRAPVGNFKQFLIQVEKIPRKIYNTKCDYIICGDFNINYLQNDSNRYKLDTLLMSYNLTSIVDFPTRTDKEASSIIDNIFIDKSKFDNYTIMPSINGLPDHNAQL
jgi:exonuclease III